MDSLVMRIHEIAGDVVAAAETIYGPVVPAQREANPTTAEDTYEGFVDGHSKEITRTYQCQLIPGLKTDYFVQEVDFPTVMLSYQSDSTGVGKGESHTHVH